MAASMNKVILIGRLGQDPKISYTTSGQAVANLSVATDEGYKDRQSGQRVEKTEWHRVVAFGQSAEFCSNYLSKGRLIMVEGRLQTRKWQDQAGQDRYSTEVIANRVAGLDSARGDHDSQEGGHRPQRQGGYQGAPGGQQGGQQGGQPGQRPQPAGSPPPYRDEDLGPAFPSEAGAMDDVPF